MAICCGEAFSTSESPSRCPRCGEPGWRVGSITVKAMLRPGALLSLSALEHRFCSTPACAVVYFWAGEVFDGEEITVPVFQKCPQGDRIVCYCLAISEASIRRELVDTGRSTAGACISSLVKAGRCACEVKNPQ